MKSIYDFNYELCSEKLALLNLPKDNLPKKGIFFRILILVFSFIKNLRKHHKEASIAKNSTVFFAFNKNEISSIDSIANKIEDARIIGHDNFSNGFPLRSIYFLSLFFIPKVFLGYLKCKDPYLKRSYTYAFDNFCLTLSAIQILPSYLKKLAPAKIIVSNHTFYLHRVLLASATALGIKTIYVQHASITENFPPLTDISYALLEGTDSLNKYEKIGSRNMEIYLIGMPKFDNYFKLRKKDRRLKTIGICTNGLDDFTVYEDLINSIQKKIIGINIIIRPHPADKRKQQWIDLATDKQILYSDVTRSISFDFFKEIDVLIAGDSNIHLEAVLSDIPSIYFDSQNTCIDWYGFLKNGLVFYEQTITGLMELITSFSLQLPEVKYRAKYYVDTLNSDFEGKSAIIAAEIISGKGTDKFQKHEGLHLNTIYKLK